MRPFALRRHEGVCWTRAGRRLAGGPPWLSARRERRADHPGKLRPHHRPEARADRHGRGKRAGAARKPAHASLRGGGAGCDELNFTAGSTSSRPARCSRSTRSRRPVRADRPMSRRRATLPRSQPANCCTLALLVAALLAYGPMLSSSRHRAPDVQLHESSNRSVTLRIPRRSDGRSALSEHDLLRVDRRFSASRCPCAWASRSLPASPAAAGLITGIIGGIIVGSLAGCPLQVSGPAAGLAVIVFELVRQHGVVALGAGPAAVQELIQIRRRRCQTRRLVSCRFARCRARHAGRYRRADLRRPVPCDGR